MDEKSLRKEIEKNKNSNKSDFLKKYFKTGKGEYAEGDVFYGLTVPISRNIAKEFNQLPLSELATAIKSKIHEERLISLLILVDKYQKTTDKNEKKLIFDFYIDNIQHINNWDLIDSSADKIVGDYLKDKDKNVLINLSNSKSIWKKRIAIISTFYFIKFQKDEKITFQIAELLVNDKHDLIHKAVGWMLREVGKRISIEKEEKFLKKHYQSMPRTMLRYAIEHFPQNLRNYYLGK